MQIYYIQVDIYNVYSSNSATVVQIWQRFARSSSISGLYFVRSNQYLLSVILNIIISMIKYKLIQFQ